MHNELEYPDIIGVQNRSTDWIWHLSYLDLSSRCESRSDQIYCWDWSSL